MSTNMISNGGRAPEIADTHVVALYNPETGKIMHLHTVTVFTGGRAVTEAQVIEAAKARAAKAGHRVEHLKVKTSTNATHGRAPHRIDISSGKFVALSGKRRKAM